MGTPLPPNEVGETCLTCFGPGQKWDGEATPKFLYAKLYGWSPGLSYDAKFEQILLTPQILQQTGSPCEFALAIDDLTFNFFFGPVVSSAFIFAAPFLNPYFYGESSIPCELVIASELVESDGAGTFGGWFAVSWNPEDLK